LHQLLRKLLDQPISESERKELSTLDGHNALPKGEQHREPHIHIVVCWWNWDSFSHWIWFPEEPE
jgi:hypothetical protein